MNELDDTFQHAGIHFSATLALPDGDGPFPAVLLLPGSGPIDRDENTRRARLSVFRDLTEHFVARGIATYRYDKRGIGRSGGDYWSCGFSDNGKDAAAAFAALNHRPEVRADRLFVLGHSEGTFHAAHLAASGLPVAGVILLGSAAGTGEDVLLWQGRAVAAAMTGFNGWLLRTLRIDVNKQQRRLFAKLRQTTRPVLRVQLVNKLNARWFREFLAHDPEPDLRALAVPTLALTGAADLQTPPDDLPRMRELNPEHIETVLVPRVSHLLRTTDGGGLGDYKRQLKQPLAPAVLEALDGWLGARVG